VLVAVAAAGVVVVGALLIEPSTAKATRATLYKNPQCECCEAYAAYLRRHGYDVTVIPTHDLPLIKREHGVPTELDGCHTTLVGNYVIEGHVPVATVDKLLNERPGIKGISLPGMPEGSPGMTGSKRELLTIYELGNLPARVYAVE
jgi:hypothetical protein